MSFGARVIAALGWTAGGRLVAQVVAWGVTIVVMRILDPTDYGLLAMATVLTGFAGLFASLGLGGAVVHAREIDTATLRGVFGMVIAMNCGLFVVVYFTAPAVAIFFGEDRLTAIIRVIAIQFLVGVIGVIPDSMLARELEFKRRALLELSASIVGAATTLALALAGWGVWSLVYGSLVGATWSAVGLNFIRPFFHLPILAFRRLRELFAFGGYVIMSRMLLYTYLQADMVIGGRFLGKEQVGYYSVGMHLASLPVQRISAILNEVAFPAFARIQDERERVARYLLQSIRLLSLLSFPVFWGIAAVAPEFVRVLLGDKWEPAILPLQLLALLMPIRMIGQLMPPTLQGIGQAKLVARNQLQACVVMVIAFLVGVRYGIIGLSLAWLVAFPLVFLVNLRTWLPVLGMPANQLLGAMARPAVAAAGMFGAVAAARLVDVPAGAHALTFLVLVGVASYVALSFAINREGVRDLTSLVQGRRSRAPRIS